MTLLMQLPDSVTSLLRTALVTEFATVSAAGIPIDTPVSYFNPEDLASIDIATGLSYPAKAERARRNPKVGLLIEGEENEPVVSIAGFAAVQDSDLQGNADRYIAETAFSRPGNMAWKVAHKAVWYWTRMIVSVQPVHVMWWENRGSMDGPPKRINAAEDAVFRPSDPAPPGPASAANKWPTKDWRLQIEGPLRHAVPGHLSLCDQDGYPLPMPVTGLELTASGVSMKVPGGAPWEGEGKACLTFRGAQTFVGDCVVESGRAALTIERALPIHPFVAESDKMWTPDPEIRDAFMRRLNHEVERRGQPVPTISPAEPQPSPGARLRMAKYVDAWWS